MTRNLAPLISRSVHKAEEPPSQVIATVLINNKLTYANEAKRTWEIRRAAEEAAEEF